MALRDLKANVGVSNSLAPAARTATASGTGVDTRGRDSAMVVFHAGTITDGTHTPVVQESDDDSTYTDVAAADLDGTAVALTSNSVQRLGYKGSKRYVRARATVSGATTGGVYAATVVLGHAHQKPV